MAYLKRRVGKGLVLLLANLMVFNVALGEKPDPISLIEAVKANDSVLVKSLLASGSDVSQMDEAGVDALGYAAKSGNVDIGLVLLSHGANLDKLVGGFTPLMRAVYYGHEDFVTFALAKGSNQHIESPNGYAAFDWALETGRNRIMMALLQADLEKLQPSLKPVLANLKSGALNEDQSALPDMGSLPAEASSLLTNFVMLGRGESGLAALLKTGVDVNTHNKTGYAPLPLACRLKMEACVKLLLAHGADPNIGNQGNDEASPLLQSARGGHVAFGTLLLSHGADVNKNNARGYTALILASLYGHQPFVAMLLKKGANLAARVQTGQSAVDFAVAGQRQAVLAELLGGWAKQAAKNPTEQAILESVLQGNRTRLKAQLKREALPENQAWQGHLLNFAVAIDRLDFVETMCQQGFSAGIIPESGFSPMTLAAHLGHHEMLPVLHAAGAEVDAPNQGASGATALMEAARGGHVLAAIWLLKQGAEVNRVDQLGDHALNYAARAGHVELLEILLEAGADPAHAGQSKSNAFQLASQRGQKAAAAFLKSWQDQQAKLPQ